MPTVLGSTKRRGRGDVDVLELELVLEPVKRNVSVLHSLASGHGFQDIVGRTTAHGVWLFKLIDSTEADSCGLDG
jgi:hypothetical protein